MTQRTDNQEAGRRKGLVKRGRFRKTAAVFLALLLSLSPLGSVLSGSFAQAAQFKIEAFRKGSMLDDDDFYFFKVKLGTGIYYWIKSDGSPLFCVQKDKALIDGLSGSETSEEYGNSRYFSSQQYELVSLVLQSCGMRRDETRELTPGEYLAGQAAVWGILTGNWEGTDQLKEEMEVLYGHVEDWNEWTSDELVEDARNMTDAIARAIDDYFGDDSPYLPSFASKYPNRAPLWQAEWEDDVCVITFDLNDRAEAVREFTYELPQGWSCWWEGDQITFQGEEVEPGTYSISGYAPEGTGLSEAMPIGLIYIVYPTNYPSFQHLASSVEVTAPWSCYFRLYVPEKPDTTGTWSLEETRYYRHQEEFEAVYGAQLEKRDGETGDLLKGAVFQPLEYFESGQLKDTVLDQTQFAVWEGWQERCPEEVTGEDGRVVHIDRKTYHYEKTYCGGHPEPEIQYEGNSEARREEIEAEAWAAWEAEAEACAERCDYHQIDGSAAEEMEADRDLAYSQFIRLVYGYTFQETQAPDGYLLPEGGDLQKVFCVSLQAGGKTQDAESTWTLSAHTVPVTRSPAGGQAGASAGVASSSDAARPVASPSDASSGRDTAAGGSQNSGVSQSGSASQGSGSQGGSVSQNSGGSQNGSTTQNSSVSHQAAAEQNATSSQARRRAVRQNAAIVWLTSTIPPLETGEADYSALYTCFVDNFRETPEEPTPEETIPEEPTPEEPTPEETIPEEPTPEEPTPEETAPEELAPEETTPGVPVTATGSGSEGKDRDRTESTVTPETEASETPVRQGWIEAVYEAGPASGSEAKKAKEEQMRAEKILPKTGDGDRTGRNLLLALFAGSGMSGALLWFRRRKRGRVRRSRKGGWFTWMFLAVLLLTGWSGQRQAAYAAIVEPDEGEVIIRYFDDEDGAGGADAFIPAEWYEEEEGVTYYLDSSRKVEEEVPEKRERQTRTMMFYGIEDPAQIPNQIPAIVQDEENQRQGSGTLEQMDIEEMSGTWSEDFQVVLTFYDYGAESYRFGDLSVPGEDAFAFLVREQDAFLESIGCSPLRYRINTFVWDGEDYLEDGIACRKAIARGARLLSDYRTTFSGVIDYPAVTRSRWQVVYRRLRETLRETEEAEEQAEPQAETVPVQAEEEPPEEEPRSPGWKITRLLIACTISLVVLIPFLLFLLVYAGKRKKSSYRE